MHRKRTHQCIYCLATCYDLYTSLYIAMYYVCFIRVMCCVCVICGICYGFFLGVLCVSFCWCAILSFSPSRAPTHVCSLARSCRFSRCPAVSVACAYRVAKTKGCLKLQVFFRKRATNYRALLRKMTCKDKASYGSSPPCTRSL